MADGLLSDARIAGLNWAEVVRKALSAGVNVGGMRDELQALGSCGPTPASRACHWEIAPGLSCRWSWRFRSCDATQLALLAEISRTTSRCCHDIVWRAELGWLESLSP